MALFSDEKQFFNLPNAELIYVPNFFTKEKADNYFKIINSETNWQHDDITVFGKTYKQPRLTALFGESNQTYSYSNITMYPNPFTSTLNDIKQKVEGFSNHHFNTLLINLYRNGNDSNGWHADNEKELGQNPIIASVSFGAERYFHLKHRNDKSLKQKLLLQHGSLLLMQGKTQHYWLHQIAKTKKEIGQRINLTFRIIK